MVTGSTRNTPLLGVSMGDPAGIGPEVILKAIAAFAGKRGGPSFVVIGDMAAMRAAASSIKNAPALHPWRPSEPVVRPGKGVSVLSLTSLPRNAIRPGRPTTVGAGASYEYVVAGARMALRGEVDALVTAPISKEWMNRAGHHFPGHTELLAKLARTRRWRMMFAGGELTLALVTTHVALGKVPAMLSRRTVLDTIRMLNGHMRKSIGIARPRIGVLGFNPHAGESGLFGLEETRAITPAIARAKKEGIDAVGPLAPDTAFIRPAGKFKFDAAVAMYHDQGLIALKTLEFDRAVNVTLGLPFVRTSPDHGTAFEIAGKGIANPSSMIAAIEYAWRAASAPGTRARRAAA